jgi:hypothetical protein
LSKNLYQTWTRLGVAFNESFKLQGLVNLEKTLLETCELGRQDSRLLFGMLGWLMKHHDLVNGSILIRLVKKTPKTAVLGAIIDAVLAKQPRSSLKNVRKYCKPLTKAEFLFNRIGASPTLAKLNREQNLNLWKNWGLISREIDEMAGAIAEKAFVLKNNNNLAIRALFGAGIRAEILSYFMEHEQGNAYEIAKQIGLSYEPVYSELQFFQKIGLMIPSKIGKALVFQLRPNFIQKTLNPLLN